MSRLSKWWRRHHHPKHSQSTTPVRLDPVHAISGAILSLDPPIAYTTFDWPDATRSIRSLANYLGPGPAAILVYMSWAFDRGSAAANAVAELRQYRQRCPRHQIHL